MKAKEINGKVKKGLPKYYKQWAGGFDTQSVEVHEQEGFFEVIQPIIDYKLQTIGDIYWDDTTSTFMYPVIDKTDEQLQLEISQKLDALDNDFNTDAIKRLLQKVAEPILADEANLTEQDIVDAATLYPQYRVNIPFKKGSRFTKDGQLYEVTQPHTSQSDWLPESTPALYKKFTPAGLIAEWVQPAGAHDAYQKEAKVTYNGKTYESTADANVWAPGVYGWVEL